MLQLDCVDYFVIDLLLLNYDRLQRTPYTTRPDQLPRDTQIIAKAHYPCTIYVRNASQLKSTNSE